MLREKAFLGCEFYSRLHLAQGYWTGYGSRRRELEFLVKVNFLSQIASLEMIEIKLSLMDSASLPPREPPQSHQQGRLKKKENFYSTFTQHV